MTNRIKTLRIARQYRTCPPPDILENPAHAEAVAAHMGICPYCAEGARAGKDPWEALSRELDRVLEETVAAFKVESAAPGEIRQVREELGRWRDRLYYNPPMVLVLETVPEIPDAVTVAQVYHDPLMAGPGDLILTEEYSFLVPLFIEPWNIYTLSGESLGPAIDSVPGHILEAVKDLTEDETIYPAWAQRPVPMTENDTRVTFRRMEVETGYTFSAPDVERLVRRIEGAELRLVYSSSSEVTEAMVLKSPGLAWPVQPESIEEALTLARFPMGSLPLAASDEDGPRLFGKLIETEEGRIVSVNPAPISVFKEGMEKPGIFSVDGRIEELPEHLENARFLAFFVPEGGSPLVPSDVRWDIETGSFLVRFQSDSSPKGRFRMAVVFER